MKFLILVLIAVVVWLAWLYFKKIPTPFPPTIVETKVEHVVTEEKYGKPLRIIADKIFSPLDTKAPNPVAELTRFTGTAKADVQNDLITEHGAETIIRVCTQLISINTKREFYATEYLGILKRRYSSFWGRFGEAQARQHFLIAHMRNWQEYTDKHRPKIYMDLDELREAERQKEIEKQFQTTPPTVQVNNSSSATRPAATTLAAVKASDFTYTTNTDNTIIIIGYTGTRSGIVFIPSTTKGKTVTRIGYRAFANCTNLTSVTIPDSVTSIEASAFGSCTRLISVTIPSSVTSIGNYAFNFCTRLHSITIPKSVTSIGVGAFRDCTSLTGVYFEGNAPGMVLDVFAGDANATVYYLVGTTGWGSTFGGRPTAVWKP